MSDINLASTDSESKTPAEREPAIKWGWVRALLLLVVWFIVYAVVTSLMAVVMITLSGQDPMKMMSDQANLIKTIGVGPATLIHLIGFGSTLLVIWIFRRFIDRRSLLFVCRCSGLFFCWFFMLDSFICGLYFYIIAKGLDDC